MAKTEMEVKNERQLCQIITESIKKHKTRSDGSSILHTNIQFLEKGLDETMIKPVGLDEGVVNFIFRISEKNGSDSVIVKWALPHPRMAMDRMSEVRAPAQADPVRKPTGEAKPDIAELLAKLGMSVERNAFECDTLRDMNKAVPNSTPHIYFLDRDKHFFLMEDLKEYRSFHHELSSGVIKDSVFRAVGSLVGRLHRATHVKALSEDEFSALSEKYRKAEFFSHLEMLMSEMVFSKTAPHVNRRDTEPLRRVCAQFLGNEEVMEICRGLARRLRDHPECFTHSDLHPGAFMVNTEDSTIKIIDPEWCTVSRAEKDFGHFLGEIVTYYYVYEGRGQRDKCEEIMKVMKVFCDEYMSHMSDYISDQEEFMQWAAGYAGHQAALRLINFPMAEFAELQESEADAVQAALRLFHGMKNIKTIDRFIFIAFALC